MSKKSLKPVDLDLDEPGKDLSRLFASSLAGTPDIRQATNIPVERLLDNPYQPRTGRNIDMEALNELADVIRAQGFQGVLAARPHPDIRGHYQLTAGHRRREAARLAGLTSLPVVVQDLTDEEMVTLAITENIQREDLTPLEEGRIYVLMNEQMKFTLEQIGREVGKKLGYIYNRVRVAKAPPDIQELVEAKPDSLRAVANLIKVEREADRAVIIRQLLAGALTTDDLPVYIQHLDGERDQTEETAPDPGSSDGYAVYTRAAAEDSTQAQHSDGGAAGTEHEPAARSTVLVNGVAVAVERPSDKTGGETNQAAPKARSHAKPSADAEERARLRARRSKLSRMLGMLQSFGDSLEEEAVLSREERIDLATIAVLANRLCLRFDIDPQDPRAG